MIVALKQLEISDLRLENQPSDRASLAGLMRCLPTTLNGMMLTTAGLMSDKNTFAAIVCAPLGSRSWMQLTDSMAVAAVLLFSKLALHAQMGGYDCTC